MVGRAPFRSLIVALSVGLVLPAHAWAQQASRVGLSIGYPASIGVLWHVSDGFAIRPEFSIAGGSSESATQPGSSSGLVTSGSNTTGDSHLHGAGVSALIFLGRWENLRAYITPRVSYSDIASTTESAITGVPGASSTVRSSIDGHAISAGGAFGALYRLGNRFGVFGELGLTWTEQETETTTTSGSTSAASRSTGTSTNWGTRSGVGVVFYF
jgi:hypothetical protein